MAVAMEGTAEACAESLGDYGKSGYCLQGQGVVLKSPCPPAGGLIVSVTTVDGQAICDATVTAWQGEGTWDLTLAPPDGEPCTYVGNSGESGLEIRIAAQALGYIAGSSTVTGGGCDVVTIGLDAEP
jgi:hypothetical protein